MLPEFRSRLTEDFLSRINTDFTRLIIYKDHAPRFFEEIAPGAMDCAAELVAPLIFKLKNERSAVEPQAMRALEDAGLAAAFTDAVRADSLLMGACLEAARSIIRREIDTEPHARRAALAALSFDDFPLFESQTWGTAGSAARFRNLQIFEEMSDVAAKEVHRLNGAIDIHARAFEFASKGAEVAILTNYGPLQIRGAATK